MTVVISVTERFLAVIAAFMVADNRIMVVVDIVEVA